MRTFLMILLIVALLMAGCKSSTIISSLEAAVTAAEIAIPVIGAATGLNPNTSAAIVTYLQQVNIAAAQAATILAGAGSSAQKAAQIVQAFAKIAAGCNCVPPGTPQEVVSVVNAVAQAVLNFISNFPVTPAPPPVIKVSPESRAKLASIRLRAEVNTLKLQGVHK